MTDVRHATHPDDLQRLDAAALRERFVLDALFAPGEVRLGYVHEDRLVVGGVVCGAQALELPVPDELRAEAFCERRELGVVCLEGPARVEAGEEAFELERGDVLYVGRGTPRVAFSGEGGVLYLVSCGAHADLPTTLSRRAEADALPLGDDEHANRRTIRKHVWSGGVASCRLALGVTTLEPGSVWNTMPTHTHARRTEVYLYFGLGQEDRVVHLHGRPEATRSLLLGDREVVVSPPWSIHAGAGTRAYEFVWATGGENSTYDDMDAVPTAQLR